MGQCRHTYSKECAAAYCAKIIQKYGKIPICFADNCNHRIMLKEMQNLVTYTIYKKAENIFNKEMQELSPTFEHDLLFQQDEHDYKQGVFSDDDDVMQGMMFAPHPIQETKSQKDLKQALLESDEMFARR